ncbi:TonB-dependent receptor [Rapidithrix thailandica]|uniref:TonB-dependent receptor n=1 Tax=Rapidithrix thailandica TaxID=413964 RepID=A0AAW9SGG1_9BACT
MKLTYLFKGRGWYFYAPPKPLWIMRLTLFLTLALSFQLTAKSHSQVITVSEKNSSLVSLLKAIESQTEYHFIYNDELMEMAKPVSIRAKNISLEKALNQIFVKQPLSYNFMGKYIVIKPKEESLPKAITVTGTVYDEGGAPLPGAAIRIKGKTQGTISDEEGKYRLAGIEEEDVLIISYIGYTTQEIQVNKRTEIDITMQVSTSALSEVVVIGYGSQERNEVTSAISSFKPSEVDTRPVLGPDQLVQGRMPGVLVSAGGGTPGSNVRVSVRGIGSLSAQNEPLYVVDGIPLVNHNAALYNLGEGMNPLAELNPNDIESIEVLKDAASAAIYGSRATNGVIIITTKTGKSGVSKLDINASYGVQNLPNLDNVKMADSDLYLEVLNEGINNYNQQNGYQPGDKNFVRYRENPYPGLDDTDWIDLVLQQAKMTNVNLSFSSGTEKTKLYVSGSYLDQEGVIISNRFRKYTGKLNINHKLLDWLKVGTNSTLSFSRNNRIPNSNIGSSVLLRSVGQRPFDRPYKPNGEYYVGGTEELIFHNNQQIINEQDAKLDNYRYLGNFFANLQLHKNLYLENSLGIDAIYTEDFLYYKATHPYGTGSGRILDRRRLIGNVLIENTLHYDKTFGDLSFSALVGHSFQKVSTSTSYIDGRGFPSPSFDVISVAGEIAGASTGFGESALDSYYSRVNLSWAGKYLMSLSLRADGSSKFSNAKRYGAFPSVSLGWNVSKEKFWNVKGAELKVRTSFGATGNQDGIGSYAYQALMGGGANYGTNSGIAITTFGNENLTWETAEQFDIGIDLSLFEGKINFTTDYFVKNTNNLLYSMPIHATSGFTSITSNIGSMQNKGLEFMLNVNQNLGPVEWSSDFNISFIRNELTNLLGDEPLLIGANRTLQVGEEVGSFYMYKMLGIFQSDEEIPQTLFDQGVRAGDVHYEDVNGDGLINVDDRQVIGSSNPDFYGGWNNRFRYKNFDFNVFFTYAQGFEVYAPWRIVTDRLGIGFQGMREEVALNRWTGPGSSNDVPRAIYGSGYNIQNSSRFLEDGSYIRLRSLSLGYTLPENLSSKLKLSKLRVYFQGDNLWLISKYSGLDPEVTKNFDPRFMAEDNFNLPQPRSFSFGINASF